MTKVEPAEDGMQSKDTEDGNQSPSQQDEPLSWEKIALIWDKFCFVVFVVITVVVNLVFVLVLSVGGENSSKN